MKKIMAVLAVMAFCCFSCSAPEGTGYSGSEESGARLYISDYDSGGAYILFWSTPVVATVTLTFVNEPLYPQVDPSKYVSITLLHYDLEYFSDDDDAVRLSPFYDLPIYLEVPGDGEATITDLPAVLPETISQYNATGDPTQSIAYRGKMTFHGETEFGYNVKTYFNYILLFGSFAP